MRRVFLFVFASVLVGVVLVEAPRSAVAAPCPVTSVDWVGGDGVWSDALSWSGGVVPTGSDNVCVPGGVVVTVDGVGEAQELVSDGVLVVPTGSSLTVNGESTIAAIDSAGLVSTTSATFTAQFTHLRDGATVNAGAGTEANLNGGTDLTGGTVSFTGDGLVSINRSLIASAPTTIESLGTAVWLGNCSRDCNGGVLDGRTAEILLTGNLVLPPNAAFLGAITNNGTITAPPVGQNNSDWHAIVGDFTNNGTIVWDAVVGSVGTADFTTTSAIVNNGTIEVNTPIRLVDFDLGGSFVNNGMITIAADAWLQTNGLDVVNGEFGSIRVSDDGVLDTGYSQNGIELGSLTNNGSVWAGVEPAGGYWRTLNVIGDFVQGSSGSLVFVVAGPTGAVPVEFGSMDVSGVATLGGEVSVERVGGFDPVVGESYPVLSYGSHVGDFGSLSGLDPWWAGSVGSGGISVMRVVPDSSSAVTGTAGAGGVVETDQAVSAANPFATSVQSPTGGLVSIVELSPVPVTPPAGYEVVGSELSRVSAPDGSVADPLLITFTVDAAVWDGIPLGSLSVLRNGVLVGDCVVPGASGSADPDPCVGDRSGTPGSPAEILVRTSQASDWVIVRAVPSNAAPVCDVAVADPGRLWPPNHRWRSIVIDGVTDPDGDVVSLMVTSIFQDEPVNGRGDGNTVIDGRGVGTSTPQVRAERAGRGNGRVYHIAFTADDGNGGSCDGVVTVGVPKNRSGIAVDDGAVYDSTTNN